MTQTNSNQPQLSVSEPISKRIVIVAALVFAGMAIAVFRGIHSRVGAAAALHQTAEQSALPAVTVVYPTAPGKAQEIELPGNTQAFIDTPIYARTSGYVKQWLVDIGAHVKQGQLLAVIETPELDQQLHQARAELKSAEANQQIAQTTSARWQELLKTDSVSHQEAEQYVSDLHSRDALVDASKAIVDRLEQLQSFEHVVAPFAGVITARNTDIGALIQAGDNTTPKELFHLASVHKLRIFVSVPELYAPSVRPGEQVEVTLDAFPGEKFNGSIVRNADAIDPSSRTLNVEVDVDNADGRLMPGAYSFVHFKTSAAHGSVTIPSSALLFRAEGLRVGVVRNSHVALIPITIGQDYGDSVEVLSGLSDQDAVISTPSDSLANGTKARVEGVSATGAHK